MKSFFAKNVDLFGVFSSGICAIHCLSLPFLFSLGFIGSAADSEYHRSSELLVIFLSLTLIFFSIQTAMKRGCQNKVLIIFIIGISTILFGWFNPFDLGHYIMALGGCLVALGHFLNHYQNREKKMDIVSAA